MKNGEIWNGIEEINKKKEEEMKERNNENVKIIIMKRNIKIMKMIYEEIMNNKIMKRK